MTATGVASWEWLSDGALRTRTAVLPAFGSDGRGRPVFANALAAVYLGWTDARNKGPESVLYGGSGAPLAAADVAFVETVMRQLAVNIPWQQGDVMLLDNTAAMHARAPFTPPRRILAYVCV